ncbi:MAG: alanine-zipper protein [Gammaproteobacteria bacterium]|nr:alanine-zipper protein [Gammaproteobacteria bacterium]
MNEQEISALVEQRVRDELDNRAGEIVELIKRTAEAKDIADKALTHANDAKSKAEGVEFFADETQGKIDAVNARSDEAQSKVDAASANADEAQRKAGAAGALADESRSKAENASSGANDAQNKADAASAVANDAQSKVDTANARVDEVIRKTDELNERTNEVLGNAESALDMTEKALSNAAAVGVSGAIHERYEEEKKKGKINLCWLAAAAGTAGVAVWIGHLTIAGQEQTTIGAVVARIAMMSVAISAAWFCASQYVRYRNTLDDYGYKSVLAMSIIAFLDQFKENPKERENYLSMVLGEIHRDPLRKNHDVDSPTTRLFRWFGKSKNETDASS